MTQAGSAADPHPTIVERLRDATRDAHTALEAALDWQRTVSTRDGYRRLLGRFHGFHAGWEPAIAALLDDPAFSEPRRRTHLLAADLLALGLAPGELDRLPVCPPIHLQDRAGALGAMYVLEGSTLGGQVVARHVVAELGLCAGQGCSYYTAHGAATGRMWRAFRQRLLDEDPGADAGAAMVRAAQRTFTCLGEWLTRSPAAVRQTGPARQTASR